MATQNKKFVIKNGLAVGGASGIIDIVDSAGTWIGATGILHGATGPAGTNGTDGATGSAGTNGTNGSNGTNGATGARGASGAAGFNGSAGATGARGPDGIQGASGAYGATGSAGTNGATGISGATGAGVQGATGISGATGAGVQGATGISGATGSQGPSGQSSSYYNYKADTSSQSGAPGSGKITWNNVTLLSANTLRISHVTNDTAPIDIDIFLGIISVNDILIIQEANDSARYQKWQVTGAPVAYTHSYFEYPVTLLDSGGTAIANNNELILAIVSVPVDGATGSQGASGVNGAAGASGSAGTNGATGVRGASGAAGFNGAAGASGSAGINGATGAQGIQGASGSTGPTGATGASPAVTTYTANTASLTNGANVSGSITDIQTFNDGNSYAWTDGTMSGPAWIFDVGFTAVDKFNLIDLNVNYTTASGHTIYVQLYNNTTSSWDSIGSYNGLAGYYQFELSVISSTPYVNSGAVSLRLYHSNTGNAGHQTYLDYVALVDSIQGGQGPAGKNGASGAAGSAGASGIAGATGSAGSNGATGPTGGDGAQGASGASGIFGATGIAGQQGASGASGIFGATGIAGASGPAGSNGTNGADGATGPAGSNGISGASGFVGSNGATGPAGSNGTSGATGATGIIGSVTTLGASGTYYPVIAGSTGPLSAAYLNTNYTFNPGTGVLSAPFVNASGTITGSNNYGAIYYGTLNYSDVNILASFSSSVNTYNQILLQNKSNGTDASTNFVVSNDLATNSTNYGEFGMNSSGFNGGTASAMHQANTVYLASQSTDLAIGTYGTNNVHFLVNNSAVDSMTINANTSIQVNSPFKVTTGATGYSGATGAVGAPSGYFNNLYVNGTAITGGGASITDDTSTNASYYPAMYSVTTGTPATVYTSSSKIYFNPSTGTLNSTIYNSLSDKNKKKNVKKIKGALSVVDQLNGVEFQWKDTGVKSYGVIAQELEKVLPDLVTTDDKGNKSVNYNGLFGFLINAIKEQQKQIDDLKKNK